MQVNIMNYLLVISLAAGNALSVKADEQATTPVNGLSQEESATNEKETSNQSQNRFGTDLMPINSKQQTNNKSTANAVNRIPGVHIEGKDLQPPTQETPIHGFHPIKKMLQPVVRLEKNSVELEQQIMKLEGPIAGLQPAMLGLQKKMGSVEQRMGNVDDRIVDMGQQVKTVSEDMRSISKQMTAVRSDINGVGKDIGELKGPIQDLHKPLAEVAQPLQTVDQKLEKLAALLTAVLCAIVLAAGAVAIGTPVAAILIYKHRRRLFPDLSDREFPVAKVGNGRPAHQEEAKTAS